MISTFLMDLYFYLMISTFLTDLYFYFLFEPNFGLIFLGLGRTPSLPYLKYNFGCHKMIVQIWLLLNYHIYLQVSFSLFVPPMSLVFSLRLKVYTLTIRVYQKTFSYSKCIAGCTIRQLYGLKDVEFQTFQPSKALLLSFFKSIGFPQ